jgi:hypothetical protein
VESLLLDDAIEPCSCGVFAVSGPTKPTGGGEVTDVAVRLTVEGGLAAESLLLDDVIEPCSCGIFAVSGPTEPTGGGEVTDVAVRLTVEGGLAAESLLLAVRLA